MVEFKEVGLGNDYPDKSSDFNPPSRIPARSSGLSKVSEKNGRKTTARIGLGDHA